MLLAAVVLSSGCIFGGGEPDKPNIQYVEPCNVAGEGLPIQVNTTKEGLLSTENVKFPLAEVFVDDIVSPAGQDVWPTYEINCWWGTYVGERRDYYYCGGSYIAPELNQKNVITRYIKKKFKIGFSVEKHEGESWIDLQGKQHTIHPYYTLTIRSIESVCYVYTGQEES